MSASGIAFENEKLILSASPPLQQQQGNMDSFSTMNMPYMGGSMQMPDLQNGNFYLQDYDQDQYDAKVFPSYMPVHDDFAFPSQQHMVPPDVRRFSVDQFHDPFAPEIMMPFEGMPQEAPFPQDSSVEGNDKLLLFSMPVHHYTLADHSLNRTSISISAKLDGSFLAAESVLRSSPGGDGPPPVVELTCYRRNLFQIEGTVIVPNTLRYIITDEGNRIPIFSMELAASATESVEGQPAKIISVPWKIPASASGEGQQPEDKAEKEPATYPLDIMSSQDPDSEYTTFPFSWRRLQFRNATANNGRRKELQQHYTLKLTIYATLSTGHKIALCDAVSGPVIVRGRSPRNFQSRRDIPISGSAVTSRRNAHFYLRNSAAESSKANSTGDKRSKSPEKATSTGHPTPGSNANVASPSASPYAQTIKAEKSNTAKSTHSSDSIHHFEKRRRTSSITHAPIPLSLSEDDPLPDSLVQKSVNDGRVKRQRSESETSPSIQRHSPPATAGSQHSTSRRKDSGAVKSSMVSPNQVSQQLAQSLTPLATNNSVYPTDIADVLYEYFPLPPEDWQGPVDGVYRPHVVHHTALDDMKLKNWSRTYFAGAGEAT